MANNENIIEFNVGCGALRFNMSPEEVAEEIGPPVEIYKSEYSKMAEFDEWRDNLGWRSVTYENNKLKCLCGPLAATPIFLNNVSVLELPILTLVEILSKENGGIFQAQGGSLYFERIGTALHQFETHICEILLISGDSEFGEPLRKISFDEMVDYYLSSLGLENLSELDWQTHTYLRHPIYPKD